MANCFWNGDEIPKVFVMQHKGCCSKGKKSSILLGTPWACLHALCGSWPLCVEKKIRCVSHCFYFAGANLGFGKLNGRRGEYFCVGGLEMEILNRQLSMVEKSPVFPLNCKQILGQFTMPGMVTQCRLSPSSFPLLLFRSKWQLIKHRIWKAWPQLTCTWKPTDFENDTNA